MVVGRTTRTRTRGKYTFFKWKIFNSERSGRNSRDGLLLRRWQTVHWNGKKTNILTRVHKNKNSARRSRWLGWWSFAETDSPKNAGRNLNRMKRFFFSGKCFLLFQCWWTVINWQKRGKIQSSKWSNREKHRRFATSHYALDKGRMYRETPSKGERLSLLSGKWRKQQSDG